MAAKRGSEAGHEAKDIRSMQSGKEEAGPVVWDKAIATVESDRGQEDTSQHRCVASTHMFRGCVGARLNALAPN